MGFSSMAAWRFGCGGDCSWEWNLVTLGIVAAVLALVALFICCAVASDDSPPSGCIGFCIWLMLIFIVLMDVGFGLGLYSSNRPSWPPKFMTIYNQQCWNKCTREGTTYFWCWTGTLTWNYCSEDARHTRYGQECLGGCVSHGKSYFWCYNTLGGWDYCSPPHKDSAIEHAPPITDDVTIYNEKCETRCDTYGNAYFWCWTSSRQMLWDYCSRDNRNGRHGQVTLDLRSFHVNRMFPEQECADRCAKRNEKFFWCNLKPGGWDYCSPKKLTGVTLHGGSGGHEGNVYLEGRPVCDDSWDDTDAEVVCRLRHSARMRAGSSPTSTHFQSVPKVVEIYEIC